MEKIDKKIEKAVKKEVKELGLEGKISKRKWSNEEKAMIGVIIVLAISLAVVFYPDIKNINIKPSVSITEITGCEDCFNVSALAYNLIKDNVKISSRKNLDYNSDEAKKLIEKYKLNKIPALIIMGGVDKLGLDENVFRIEGKTAIFDKPVPYLDLSSGEIKGLVSLKEISTNCKDCASLSQISKQLEFLGIKVKDYEIISDASEQGKNLVKENNLSFLPGLLISKNIEEYWWTFDKLKSSFVKEENYYLFKAPIPPYKDLATGSIKGKVNIIYLTDNECEDCFNVTQLKGAFQNLGIYIDKERYVDFSSADGKILLNEYNITAVPTVILSKEISDYESIKDALEQVGSFENKEFVLRNLDALKVKYKKLGG